jgi:hypothetical protein
MGCKCMKINENNENEIEADNKINKNHIDSVSNDFLSTVNKNENQSFNLKQQIENFQKNPNNKEINHTLNILEYKQSNSNKNSINNNNNNNIPIEYKEFPKDAFSKYVFEHINKVRTNPKDFISKIEESKSKITIDKYNRLIYKSKVKVALSKGKSAFDEAILLLNNTEPMNELIFNPKMCVPLPSNELDIQNKNYLKEKVNEMVVQNIIIRTYWRDIIKDAETSFILMIVDDNGNKSGMKRKDILDPKMKYIGISSVMIGKSFVCYLTFSDRLIDDFF